MVSEGVACGHLLIFPCLAVPTSSVGQNLFAAASLLCSLSLWCALRGVEGKGEEGGMLEFGLMRAKPEAGVI